MADEFNKDQAESQDFGDEENSQSSGDQAQGFTRVRIPRNNEVLGKVETRAGANRMIIACFDGKKRNCRVPGRLKRALWIRPRDIVLVEPWEFEGDKKGDIIHSYNPNAVQWLEKKGFMKEIKDEF